MNQALENLLRTRRLQVNNLKKEILNLVDSFVSKKKNDETEIECEALLETLFDNEHIITELTEKIQALIVDDDELTEELRNSTMLNMSMKKAKRKLQKFLEYHPNTEETNTFTLQKTNSSNRDGVRLPKIVLKTFSGDPLEWKSFKETFEAAVDNNKNISNVEKLHIC